MRPDRGPLQGAIGLNLQAGPSAFPRLMDAVPTAKPARASASTSACSWSGGFEPEDITVMVKENPEKILGL